ncbi:hypothetical protein [Sulfitobacter sp. PM12]|uniref:hypothetical protein n=1 Tax=Sulfitobacter sp. PM12 TaxID=3138497 RepID=UPI00388D5592
MTDAPDLLPCPFCAVYPSYEVAAFSTRHRIACEDCEFEMQKPTREEAQRAWNTRDHPMTAAEAATHWAITSPSGVHIGLWSSYETAKRVFDNEVNGSKLWPLRALSQGGE